MNCDKFLNALPGVALSVGGLALLAVLILTGW